MIYITDKHKCCGCSACVQVCPKGCILFNEDEEGFRYPLVDNTLCVDCGLCEKVCPCLNQREQHQPLEVFAAINPNEEIRMQSSSGGIFTMLAEATINEGGVVFGARFDENWEVVHDYTETLEGLKDYRGSKYVQSRIGDNYVKVKSFLQEGRKVLFSGTPCQIAGLKLYLRKEYENLLTVECACHGVPSPGLWQQYLTEQTRKDKHTIADIQDINFRDKRSGWQNYSFTISYKDGKQVHHLHDDNPWERAFIKNLDLRPSCHNCPTKCNQSRADITLGDLWGANLLIPEVSDNNGITLVMAHNGNGLKCLKCLNGLKCLKEFSFDEVAKYNQALKHSAPVHPGREDFFQLAQKDGFIKSVIKMTKEPLMLRMKIAIAKVIRRK